MRSAVLLLVAALFAWSLYDFATMLAGAPLRILVGAVAPALLFALAVSLLGGGRVPAALLAVAFLWGAAVAPFVSLPLNDSLRAWLGSRPGAAGRDVLAPVLLGPLVEESAKGAALAVLLLVRRGAVTGALDGLVYGAMIGVGFTMTENLSYLTLAAVQGGQAGLERAIYTRAVLAGLNHAVFTGTTGAAASAALRARGRAAGLATIVAGFAAAVAQHAVWNLIASSSITTLLCDPEMPDGPCRAAPTAWALYVDVPLVVLACLGPGLAILTLVAWKARRPGGPATVTAGGPTGSSAS